MSRLLLLIAIFVMVYLLLRHYRKQKIKDGSTDQKNADNTQPKQVEDPKKTEDMVRCTQCGIHLPKGESIVAEGKHFCSEAHRRAHADSVP